MSLLKFALNEPHIVKLSDTTADLDGANWLYSLEGGASMSLPQHAAVKLNALFPEVGEELSVGRFRQHIDQPAEWVICLTARSEQERARKELAETERKTRQQAEATRRDLPAQLAASVREIRGTGTNGPAPRPAVAAKTSTRELPPRVPYGIALAHITGTVTALLREKGEQWNDQAKQDLVSTAFISAAKAGVIAFDFQETRP